MFAWLRRGMDLIRITCLFILICWWTKCLFSLMSANRSVLPLHRGIFIPASSWHIYLRMNQRSMLFHNEHIMCVLYAVNIIFIVCCILLLLYIPETIYMRDLTLYLHVFAISYILFVCTPSIFILQCFNLLLT